MATAAPTKTQAASSGSKQLLHLVIGGELKDVTGVEFRDLSQVHLVGAYPNYKAAYDAWKGAAQRPVELGEAGRPTHQRFGGLIELHELERASAARKVVFLRKRGDRPVLDQRVPLRAVRALPLPAVRYPTAGLAHEAGLGFGHRVSLYGT